MWHAPDTASAQLPVRLRRSLTWDQGSEMALRAEIAQTWGMPVFFCEKASPWQRPSDHGGQPADLERAQRARSGQPARHAGLRPP